MDGDFGPTDSAISVTVFKKTLGLRARNQGRVTLSPPSSIPVGKPLHPCIVGS